MSAAVHSPPLNIQGVQPAQYQGTYTSDLLEQYKLYVEMADRISQRRQTANTFFLSINTLLVTLSGFFVTHIEKGSEYLWLFFVGIAGIILCFYWYKQIRSYKDLNSAKFIVIHEIELFLPIRPYDAEWTAVGMGQNEKHYLPFTHIELQIPWVFLWLYIAMMIIIFSPVISSFLSQLISTPHN